MRRRRAVSILCALILATFASELSRGAVGDEIALLAMGALPDSGQLNGEYWRLVAYSFLHLTSVHLVLNLAALWWAGSIVERRVGPWWTLAMYFVAVLSGGVAITLAHLRHPSAGSSVGASAGIFGLLGTAIVLLSRPDALQRLGGHARVRIALWTIAAVGLAGSALPGVSMAGHVGGLVAGLIGGWFVPLLL